LESFNTEFCDALTIYLSNVIRKSDHELARSCWVDGIMPPLVESKLTKKSVNDSRRLEARMWLLTGDGDKLFTLVLYFGKYSLRRYAKDRTLVDCIPGLEKDNSILVDFENETVELQLL
jgi:hypothetical protein